MGHTTILHGYIRCVGGEEYDRLNGEGLDALPKWSAEAQPLISRDMFALSRAGYQGPLIAFGRSYSGVESYWQRWREEFESLLRTLYWDEAHVWVETEWWGDFHSLVQKCPGPGRGGVERRPGRGGARRCAARRAARTNHGLALSGTGA